VSYVVINAIDVPEGSGEELEGRFARRAGQVSGSPGFEAFELLRPDNPEAGGRYFVYTRWASKSDFEAWMSSRAFGEGHRHAGSQPVGTGSQVLAYEVVQSEYV